MIVSPKRVASLCVAISMLLTGSASNCLAQVKWVIANHFDVVEEQADAAPQAENGEALQKISRKLLSPADIQADKKPLATFAADVAKQYEIPLRVDDKALKAAGVAVDVPITTSIKKGTLGQALSKALKEHKLRWEMRDTEVVITAGAKVAEAAKAPVGYTLTVDQAAPPAEAPKADPEMLQKISRKLLAAADIQADKTELSKLVADLAKKYEIPIRVDGKAIQAAGLAVDPAVTASIKKGTLGQALTAILKERNMRWELRDTEVVVTATAKAKPAAAVAVKAAPAAQIQAQAQQAKALAQAEQQFVPQFRVLWKAEMHFVREVCQPTAGQVTKLRDLSKDQIAVASARFVRGRSGRRVVNGVITPMKPNSNEPRVILQEAIHPGLETILTPEQLARYDGEVEQAQLSRRDMVIKNLVSKLDRDLQLSGEQREKLSVALTSNWDANWSMPPQMLMNLDNMFPTLPDKLIVPELNERQQQVWRGSPKQAMQNYYSGFGLFGNQIDESIWDDEPGSGPADGAQEAVPQAIEVYRLEVR
jgi:hypothetical protein